MEQLFFTTNFPKAKAEIQELGGRITQQFTDVVFVAEVPDSTNVSSLTYCYVQQPEKLDDLSHLMVNAWELHLTKSRTTGKSGIKWDQKGFQYPKNPNNDAELASHSKAQKKSGKIVPAPTSETMTGSIAVGLIIVAGPTADLQFSIEETTLVISEVMKGCQFLATAGADFDVSFVYVIHTVTIDAITNPQCSSFEGCESVFRDSALKQLGYDHCVNFVVNLRKTRQTNWAYMAFITKYPLYHFAYAYDVNLFMSYSNDGWGPNEIHRVFAHETCHIFGAADEYVSSHCNCDPSGYYQIPNYNCNNCNELPAKVDCLMKKNTLSLCNYSKWQLGWFWLGDALVPNTGMSDGPSAVVFNNRIYCFHHGYRDGSNELWYNAFDGTSWQGDHQVPNTGATSSPSVIVFNNRIYCFHQGGNSNGQLWYNVFDGTNWVGDSQVPNTGMSDGPSAIVFNNKLYCFHHGYGNGSNELWYNVFDGTNWQGDRQVPNTGATSSPSVIVFNNRIYCFHQGGNSSGQLWYNVFDGTNWTGDTMVPNTGISDGPSAVVVGNEIYCFHHGYGEGSNELWYNVFDGTNWQGDHLVPNTGATSSPSAIVLNNKIYCFHQGGNSNGQLWYNRLNVH